MQFTTRRFERDTQRLAMAEQMRLPDHILDALGPQQFSQWCRRLGGVKEFGHRIGNARKDSAQRLARSA